MTDSERQWLLSKRDEWLRTGAITVAAAEQLNRWLGLDAQAHRLTEVEYGERE